jgi:GT2 family glycosyltransferase
MEKAQNVNSIVEEIFTIGLSHDELAAASREIGKKLRGSLAGQNGSSPEKYVSLVIPFIREEKNILSLLNSIKKNTAYKNYEAILVVHETQKIESVLKEIAETNISILRIPAEINLLTGCEVAANAAIGNNIIFLHPDVEIKLRWMEHLLSLSLSRDAKIITSKVLQTNGRIAEGGYSILKEGNLVGNFLNEYSDNPAFNFVEQIPTSSHFSLFIKREVWDDLQFDEKISNYDLAIYDLGVQINRSGKKIYYQPLSVLQLQKPEILIPTNRTTMQPAPEVIDSLKPTIKGIDFADISSQVIKKNILSLGVYLGDRLNNAEDIIKTIQSATLHSVTQKWVAINQTSQNELVKKHTVEQINKFVPKFEILNNLLGKETLTDYDYILTVDDDIVLPENFIDILIYLQNKYDLALAQPARTKNSFIDHPIVQQQDGLMARETHFVEIGPVFCISKDIYDVILPFDLSSPMGWGYENIWAKKLADLGKKMGIIDAVPVDHSLRKPVANYTWSVADEQRAKILEINPHLVLADCFKVIDVKN